MLSRAVVRRSIFRLKASPRPGEICSQGMKAFAPGQAAKIDLREAVNPDDILLFFLPLFRNMLY